MNIALTRGLELLQEWGWIYNRDADWRERRKEYQQELRRHKIKFRSIHFYGHDLDEGFAVILLAWKPTPEQEKTFRGIVANYHWCSGVGGHAEQAEIVHTARWNFCPHCGIDLHEGMPGYW